MLITEQVQCYRRNGYLFPLPALLSGELAEKCERDSREIHAEQAEWPERRFAAA